MSAFLRQGHVLSDESWLGKAARAEASLLPLCQVPGVLQSTKQLILVRYTSEFLPTEFIYKELARNGAMWTDGITTLADRTADITGQNRGAQWKGLQVIRLGVDDEFLVDDLANNGNNPILAGLTAKRLATEYSLRFDIPIKSVTNIPFDVINGQFSKPPNYSAPKSAATPPDYIAAGDFW